MPGLDVPGPAGCGIERGRLSGPRWPRPAAASGTEDRGQPPVAAQPPGRRPPPRPRAGPGAARAAARRRAGPMPSSDASAVTHASGGRSSVVISCDRRQTASRSTQARRLGAQRVRGRDVLGGERGGRRRRDRPASARPGAPAGARARSADPLATRRSSRLAAASAQRRGSSSDDEAQLGVAAHAPRARPLTGRGDPVGHHRGRLAGRSRRPDRAGRVGSPGCAGRSDRPTDRTAGGRTGPSTRRCTGSPPACRPRRTGRGSWPRRAGSEPAG